MKFDRLNKLKKFKVSNIVKFFLMFVILFLLIGLIAYLNKNKQEDNKSFEIYENTGIIFLTLSGSIPLFFIFLKIYSYLCNYKSLDYAMYMLYLFLSLYCLLFGLSLFDKKPTQDLAISLTTIGAIFLCLLTYFNWNKRVNDDFSKRYIHIDGLIVLSLSLLISGSVLISKKNKTDLDHGVSVGYFTVFVVIMVSFILATLKSLKKK